MCIRDRYNDTPIEINRPDDSLDHTVHFKVVCGTDTIINHCPVSYTHLDVYKRQQYARAGRRLYEISGAIGDYAESYGYEVGYDLVGHGIGTHLHEGSEIPNFRQWRRGLKLKAGMTLAVEPMINAGSPDVEWMDDEWTVVTLSLIHI